MAHTTNRAEPIGTSTVAGTLDFCFTGPSRDCADRIDDNPSDAVHLDIGSGAGRVCKHQFGAGARSGEHRATGQGNSDRQGKLTYAGLCGREVGAAFDCELDVDKPARMIHVRLRHN